MLFPQPLRLSNLQQNKVPRPGLQACGDAAAAPPGNSPFPASSVLPSWSSGSSERPSIFQPARCCLRFSFCVEYTFLSSSPDQFLIFQVSVQSLLPEGLSFPGTPTPTTRASQQALGSFLALTVT